MFYCYKDEKTNKNISVLGIPFSVHEENGVTVRINNTIRFETKCKMLFFLGMSTELWQCSEWWGQQEVNYDHSTRLFLGDRIGRISVAFDDSTEELIPVIFGVNAWNYNLYFKPKPHEGNLMSFSAPYDEPFRSDKNAKGLLDNCLKLMENKDSTSEKATKWVFAYSIRADKNIKEIKLIKEDSKRADFVVSAVTGLLEGNDIKPEWKYVYQDFFLKKDYYADVYRLSRRLYQFRDELPQKDELLDIKCTPDIVFSGCGIADIYTNVYRKNITDMAYNKISDDGMPHTSSPNTANYGCYVGFGTYTIENSYHGHVWTRDIGRTLIELTNSGYFDRVLKATDKLHELLYYPSIRFKIPHWKRVANLIAQNENDLFNEGKENDGHASIMLFMYNLYNKGAVGKDWLESHKKELKDASDFFVWQYEHPK